MEKHARFNGFCPSPLPANSVHFSIVSIYILFSISTANDGKLTTPCGRPELAPVAWNTKFLAYVLFPKAYILERCDGL